MIRIREDVIASPPTPIASAAWRTVHAIREAVGGDIGSAIRWSPRNTPWLYLIAIGIGVGLSSIARYWLNMVPDGDITFAGTAITVLCMAVGVVIGLVVNQHLDLRRRGTNTIASSCPTTLGGLLSIELAGLLLQPMTPYTGMMPAVQIPREKIAGFAARRTIFLQIELSATFVDGSTAYWYVPYWNQLARAWADSNQ
ncbi:MAG: hypothetical protein H7123_01930 [Thermoleophilia bacterium]|nr:hypothetical protein [Thermoleophilia bacterium]